MSTKILKTPKLALVLAQLSLIAALLIPLFSVSVLIFWEFYVTASLSPQVAQFDLLNMSFGVKIAVFALSLVGALLQAYGLLGLRNTFLEAAENRALSAKAVGGFRRFAWLTLAMVFYGIFHHSALIVVLSLADPFSPGQLSISLGSNEAKALFLGLLLVFVAQVFAQGREAVEENQAFV